MLKGRVRLHRSALDSSGLPSTYLCSRLKLSASLKLKDVGHLRIRGQVFPEPCCRGNLSTRRPWRGAATSDPVEGNHFSLVGFRPSTCICYSPLTAVLRLGPFQVDDVT